MFDSVRCPSFYARHKNMCYLGVDHSTLAGGWVIYKRLPASILVPQEQSFVHTTRTTVETISRTLNEPMDTHVPKK